MTSASSLMLEHMLGLCHSWVVFILFSGDSRLATPLGLLGSALLGTADLGSLGSALFEAPRSATSV